ncbi:MAG: outer membrane protein assembly factor BamE [Phycisphaerae bacterium]|nr:outer membrane protein assembly factor BamE [Phycisphaerae bacterium]
MKNAAKTVCLTGAPIAFIVLLLICVVLASGGITTGDNDKVPNVIRAKRVEIVNDDGKTVLRLETNPKGDGRVLIYSCRGDLLLQIPADAKMPDKGPSLKGDWRDKENWRKLKRGMSKDDVRRLLGEPQKITEVTDQSWWYYGWPGGGRVEFAPSGVIGWSEP